MSQILDGNALQQVKDLVLSGYHLTAVKETACPTALLPDGVNVESLERFDLERFRFRGAMTTTSIPDFVRYAAGYANEAEPARCFIDADNMTARSVFNIGTLANPGHADNVASITLKKTAPFRALLQVNGDRLGQKEIAEWLEDWADFLSAFDADGNVLSIAQAAGAVRRVNIKQVSEAAHEASSKDVMPVAFEFKCVPYEGLENAALACVTACLKAGYRCLYSASFNWKPRKKLSPTSSVTC